MSRNKRDGKSSYRLLTRIFDRGVWALIAGFFAILTIIAFVGGSFADKYSANLNAVLNIKTQEIIGGGEEYYESDFYKKNGYDNDAMRAHSMEVAEQAAAEGAVLLWNNTVQSGGKALPIAKGGKVSLFGVATQKYLVAGGGSGYVGINTPDTVKSKLEERELVVNPKLWNAYSLLKANYGYYVVGDEAKKRVGDSNYWEYRIREIPWDVLDTSTVGKVTDTVGDYGDAAVMTVTRYTSEDGDTDFDPTVDYGKSIYNDNNLDGNYMDLSADEHKVIEELIKLKKSGTVKRVVLLMNTASPLQMKNIRKMDIDACVWVGMGGSASYAQIADVLSGAIAPSGHLADTLAYDHYSSPVTENFGDETFDGSLAGLPATNKMTHNTKTLVYQEGIYMGYRYYETRYEDLVTGKGGANGSAGVKAGDASDGWKYSSEVAYPFGYGLTYTDFSYDRFKVEKKGDDYEVSLRITNKGSIPGKEVMQVYLQKPYTEYDKKTGIEKSAVELVGFDKTDSITKDQTLTVTVKGEEFKTYDSYGKRTYILEQGDYYLAVGRSAHDALNNILALKGYKASDGMTDDLGAPADGNASLAYKIHIDADDHVKYSKSVTGYAITNQFDNADIKLYAGTKDQMSGVKYLSRSDWQGTYPSGVKITTNNTIIADMQYGGSGAVPNRPNDVLPTYDKVTVAQNVLDGLNEGKDEDKKQDRLLLVNLMEKEFDDPLWQDLLNQISWETQRDLIKYGYCNIMGISSIGSHEMKANDGPAGIKGNICPGLTSYMCFPSQQVLCCTWDLPLVNKIGDAFGMEMLHAGYTAIYGPGAGIHRSAFSGRNFEYYSEDGFISGKMFAAETRGLQKRGVIVFAKHMVLNDQERNRYGGTVWANEQAIREIYLKAFEGGIVEGKANGIMTSHNRIGATWSGAHSGLLNEILRKEWGFTGITITDAAVSDHEFTSKAMAVALVAGQDFWMYGSDKTSDLTEFKTNATVCLAMREAAHRILYNQLHSNGMNNISADTQFRDITPWWKIALTALQAVSVTVLVIAAVMTVLGIVFSTKAFGGMYVAKVDGTYVYPYERATGFKGFFVNIGRRYGTLRKRSKIILIVSVSLAVVMILTAIITPLAVRAYRNRPIPVVPPLPRETYTFEAEDPKVVLGAGSYSGNSSMPYVSKEEGSEQTYIGGFSCNVGATITYYIKAESAATAELKISVSTNYKFAPLLGAVTVLINGEMLDASGRDTTIDFEGEGGWTRFCDVSIGDVELAEGMNTVQIRQISEERGNNIDCIRLDSTAPLALVSAPSEFGDDDWTRAEFAVGVGGRESDNAQPVAPAIFTTADYASGYFGNLSGNVGAGATFTVTSDKECEAVLYLYASMRTRTHVFAEAYDLTVNGAPVDVSATMPSGSDKWTTFSSVGLGKITLAAGTNTVTITVKSDDGGLGANIAGIALTTESAALGATKHVCGHVCPDCGKCADITCNKQSCADKCENVIPKHECGAVCPDCGGCIDYDCEQAACSDKCECEEVDDGDWTEYAFDAVDGGSLHDGVVMTDGSHEQGWLVVNNNGYIGNLAKNYGATVTFGIYADSACTATLYIRVSTRNGEFRLKDAYEVSVGGVLYPSVTDMTGGGDEWEVFESYLVRHVKLVKGNNSITIKVVDKTNVGANLKGITLKTAGTRLSWEKSDTVVFNTVTGGKLSSGVTIVNGEAVSGSLNVDPDGYIGGVAMNYGATITFNIHAEKAGAAKLWLTVSERNLEKNFVFNDAYSLTVNGADVSSDADMSRDGNGSWTTFKDYLLGDITLKEGDNVITFTVKDRDELCSNFKGIKLNATDNVLDFSIQS